MEVEDYFGKFADAQFAADGASALGGLLAAETLAAGLAGRTVPVAGYQIQPNSGVDQALGGASVIVGAEVTPMVSGRMKRHAQVGGAIGIGHGVAERLGVREALQSAANGALGGN